MAISVFVKRYVRVVKTEKGEVTMRTGYAVEDLTPCPACGSRKWWYDGQEWQCWTCAPCPDGNPITADSKVNSG